jgi:hypothetical protein
MIVFTDRDCTRHWCVDREDQTVGYCVVDRVLVMLDGVDMHKQFNNNSACNSTTGKMHR